MKFQARCRNLSTKHTDGTTISAGLVRKHWIFASVLVLFAISCTGHSAAVLESDNLTDYSCEASINNSVALVDKRICAALSVHHREGVFVRIRSEQYVFNRSMSAQEFRDTYDKRLASRNVVIRDVLQDIPSDYIIVNSVLLGGAGFDATVTEEGLLWLAHDPRISNVYYNEPSQALIIPNERRIENIVEHPEKVDATIENATIESTGSESTSTKAGPIKSWWRWLLSVFS